MIIGKVKVLSVWTLDNNKQIEFYALRQVSVRCRQAQAKIREVLSVWMLDKATASSAGRRI